MCYDEKLLLSERCYKWVSFIFRVGCISVLLMDVCTLLIFILERWSIRLEYNILASIISSLIYVFPCLIIGFTLNQKMSLKDRLILLSMLGASFCITVFVGLILADSASILSGRFVFELFWLVLIVLFVYFLFVVLPMLIAVRERDIFWGIAPIVFPMTEVLYFVHNYSAITSLNYIYILIDVVLLFLCLYYNRYRMKVKNGIVFLGVILLGFSGLWIRWSHRFINFMSDI